MTQKIQSAPVIEGVLLVVAEALSAAAVRDAREGRELLETLLARLREVFANPMVGSLVADMTELAAKTTFPGKHAGKEGQELLTRMVQSTRFGLDLEDGMKEEFCKDLLTAVSRGRNRGTNRESSTRERDPRAHFDWLDGLDEELCSVFISQHRESLELIEAAAVSLENLDTDDEAMGQLRRLLHTMKGDAGLVGLREIELRAHALEDEIEDECLDLSAHVLNFVDWVREAIDAMVAHFGVEDLAEHDALAADEENGPQDVQVPEAVTSDPEITADFVTEATELLEGVEEMLLTLEGDREHTDSIHAVFRAFHSIKGVSSFLELDHIRELAHETESLLDAVRSNQLDLTDEAFDVTLATFDRMRRFVLDVQRAIGSDGKLTPDPDLGFLLKRLAAVRKGHDTTAPEPEQAPAGDAPDSPASGPPSAKQVQRGIQETIRVEPGRLDRLVDSIGELVIAESMVTKTLENQESSQLTHLRKITRELQELAMSLRMVPLRSTFRRMARLARDVAKKLGKRIEFSCVGEDAELDKTMVDAMGDPLMHMIRNAVDHGLENSAEERRANGKEEVGRITLRAYHEGGSIHIEVSDDGAGMNRDAIIGKAIDRGIITDAEGLSDSDAFSLVFEPGFSTAQQVSEVSGRGVGLDVVKRAIEALRGHVEIRSVPGQGTTFSMRLPLTLAIIDGMVVRIGEERFVIPTLDIVRIIRRNDAGATCIFDRAPVVRIGEELIPLIQLSDELQAKIDGSNDAAYVVIDNSDQSIAIAVDELIGQQQIVIKSLGTSLADVRGFAGGAIMPDGRVSLILDVAGFLASKQPAIGHAV